MKAKLLLFSVMFCISGLALTAQPTVPVHPRLIVTGTYWGESRPLRDIPALTRAEFRKLERKGRDTELNEGLRFRSNPFGDIALPKGADPVWQKVMGTTKSKSPDQNWEGQVSPYYPPDCNGTAGQDNFMQTINTTYAIYDKTGTLLAGPTPINLIFGNVPGANRNDGDPIILYDEQ